MHKIILCKFIFQTTIESKENILFPTCTHNLKYKEKHLALFQNISNFAKNNLK